MFRVGGSTELTYACMNECIYVYMSVCLGVGGWVDEVCMAVRLRGLVQVKLIAISSAVFSL